MRLRHLLPGLLVLLCSSASPLAAALFRVSVGSNGEQGNDSSWVPSISADGNTVAFMSLASTLVPGDTNEARDIFVRYRATGQTRRVSLGPAGVQANDDCWEPVISPDGGWVAFSSDATNLVPDDTNGVRDVFVTNLSSGETVRVSVASGAGQANGPSREPRIGAEGRLVAFTSEATNLVGGDTNGVSDVFLHDRSTNGTDRVSVGAGGVEANGPSRDPAISGDGTVVAFCSSASNLVSGDTNRADDVFARIAGVTDRVSVSTEGGQGNSHSQDPAISRNGKLVVFKSYATNLFAPDTNLRCDILLRDLEAKTTTLMSMSTSGLQADLDSVDPAISPDGGFVAFASRATNLTGADTNGYFDVFLRDRGAGLTRRLSTGFRVESNGNSWGPAVNENGTVIAFWSEASNLVSTDGNGKADVFVNVPGPGGGEDIGGCYGLIIDGGYLPLLYVVSVPIDLNQSDNVQGINFVFHFDPKVVQCVNVSTTQIAGDLVLTSNWELQFNINNTEGSVSIAMANDQPMAPGETGRVCYIELAPAQGATAGQSTTLSITDTKIYDMFGQPLPLCTGGGGPDGKCESFIDLQECPFIADVNRDQQVTTDDAILLLEAAVGLAKPTDWPWDWPPLECNDINGDGVIDSGDAAIALAIAAAGGDLPFPLEGVEAAAAGAAASRAAPAVSAASVGARVVSLPAATVTAGETVTVPISVDDATGVVGADFTVRYDPTIVRVIEARPTALTSGFLFVPSIDNVAGSLGIAMIKLSGIAGGGGPFVDIDFQAVAPSGKTALRFVECRLTKVVDLMPTEIPSVATDGSLEVKSATGFTDIPADYWAADEIIACAQAGIVTGYPDGSYQPKLPVNRGEMAAFVSRAVAGGEAKVPDGPSTGHFTDVPVGSWAYKYVEYAYNLKIVQGCQDGLYHPQDNVDRGQMAVFMARARVQPLGDSGVPMDMDGPAFPDVTPTNEWGWCYHHVEYLYDQGVVTGYVDGRYHPEYVCTRDQMAVYVAQAFELPM